jgi:deoxyadenosine/deoxycytidine kinase
MEPFPYNYICIEGNIGAGKTSFCRQIGEEYNCDLILEQFADNPFLPFFYEDPERYAFTVELFFMTERYKQLQLSFRSQNLFSDFNISDYTFIKNLLFARQNLPEDEYKMFSKMFHVLLQGFPQPDLMVYFHRSVDYLLKSIEKRGRAYEVNIKADYLQKVQNSYFEYFRNILSFPVLIIDLNDLDFVNNKAHYDAIKSLLSKKYQPGVHRISLMM